MVLRLVLPAALVVGLSLGLTACLDSDSSNGSGSGGDPDSSENFTEADEQLDSGPPNGNSGDYTEPNYQFDPSQTAYSAGNLKASLLTFISSDPDETPTDVAVASAARIWVAGEFATNNLGDVEASQAYLGADTSGSANLLKINPTTQRVERALYLGSEAAAVAVNSSDNQILVYGDFGLLRLSADGRSKIYHIAASELPPVQSRPLYSSGRRMALSEDGQTLALLGNAGGKQGRVQIRSASDGSLVHSLTLPASDIGGGTYNECWEDIALDAANQRVFVTGMAQRCSNYQSPFVLAYDYASSSPAKAWRSFALWCSGAQNENIGADSRGLRLHFSNNSLLFSGKADGGNNLFTREAQDHTKQQSNNLGIDRWNEGAGFGSGEVGYFANLDPGTGKVRSGQFQYTSVGVNQARSFAIRALTRSEAGEILIGGQAAHAMPQRDELSINTESLGDRQNQEAALIGVSPDFETRSLVAGVTGNAGGPGRVTALANKGQVHAAVGITRGELVAAGNHLPGTQGFSQGSFLLVW